MVRPFLKTVRPFCLLSRFSVILCFEFFLGFLRFFGVYLMVRMILACVLIERELSNFIFYLA